MKVKCNEVRPQYFDGVLLANVFDMFRQKHGLIRTQPTVPNLLLCKEITKFALNNWCVCFDGKKTMHQNLFGCMSQRCD